MYIYIYDDDDDFNLFITPPCADYFVFAQAIFFQISEDVPTVINQHAGKGWLDYFWGIVGEIPLSDSEDYRNMYILK